MASRSTTWRVTFLYSAGTATSLVVAGAFSTLRCTVWYCAGTSTRHHTSSSNWLLSAGVAPMSTMPRDAPPLAAGTSVRPATL